MGSSSGFVPKGPPDGRHPRGADVKTLVAADGGRGPQCPTGTTTVASFRTWRGSRIRSHQDPTTIRSDERCRARCVFSTPGATLELAEREGFEPSVRLPVHSISNAAPSASRSPLHVVQVDCGPACVGVSGGGGGIRTLGTRKRTTDFESAAFDHSATPPGKHSLHHDPSCLRISARWRFFSARSERKKLRRTSEHSSAITPGVTAKR